MLLTLLTLAVAGVACRPSEDTIRYQIREEEPPGTHVGNIVSDAGLRRKFPKNVLSLLEYRFLSEPPPIPLVIGLRDGVIRTSDVIDRDAMPRCRQRDNCNVLLDVTVQPVAYFLIIKISVEVTDINDNPPHFDTVPSGHTVLSILESAAVSSTFLLPSATDPDSPTFGVHSYDIASDSNKFGLSVTKKLDGFLDVRLSLRGRLDREVRHEYRLRLIAVDGGRPARRDAINVTVRVLDANDNDPIFDRQTYEVTMVETDSATGSSALGQTPIARVRATDPDLGENGRVVYGFAPQTRSLFGHLFSIDNRTGEIYVRTGVDREVYSAFQLIVTAEDCGPDSHPVDATVVVTVADVNDNRPSIVVNTLAAVGTDRAAVPENAATGTFVAHVTVVDEDAGRNGTVNCTLLGAANVFTLEERSLLHQAETEYQVLTLTALDREVTATYELSIACTDLGSPPQHTIRRLPVTVSDENDNAPEFSKPVYKAQITENNEVGAIVVQVNASDLDLGENGTVAKYKIVGNIHSRMFNVSKFGVISATAPLDRETSHVRRFHVVAIDGGSPPRSGTALVEVSVDDEDDCWPVFSENTYRMTVLENQPPGTSVGSVSARDADLPPFNTVRYAFAVENKLTDCFDIDQFNGTLTTRCRLNHEFRDVFYLTVMATSPSPSATAPVDDYQSRGEGNGTGSRTASVIVYVGDDNDNAPVFKFPVLNNDTVAISSATPEDYPIAQLIVTDEDTDANGRLTYRLEADKTDSGSTFYVDSFVGTVHVARSLLDIDHRVFRLTVIADDGGRPESLSTTSALTVVVNQSIPFTPPTSSTGIAASPLGLHSSSMTVVILGGVGAIAFLLVVCLVAASLACARRRGPFSRRQQRHLVDKCAVSGGDRSAAGSSTNGDDYATNDCDGARATEGVKMLTRDCSSSDSTPIKRAMSVAVRDGSAASTYSTDVYNNQAMECSNSRTVVNNNAVLTSFSGHHTAGQADASSVDTSSASELGNNPTNRSVDLTGSDLPSSAAAAVPVPSAVVSGGTGGVNCITARVPWQRDHGSSRGWTRGTCSYGVSSPCCKLLPASTTTHVGSAASSHLPSSCHQQRSVTLPRGHPAIMYSGEIATRLRPPPPPSAAAIRQATQRAAASGSYKTLDMRSRSQGRSASGFKTDSDTEQRKSISTVIV